MNNITNVHDKKEKDAERAIEYKNLSNPMHGTWTIANRELKKWYKVPLLLLMTLIQPIIWLGLFGKAANFGSLFSGSSFNISGLNIPANIINSLGNSLLINTFGTTSYFSFLSVGMLVFVIVFTAMFSGMSIVWDRRLGYLNKILSAPIPRGSIVVGKVLSSVVRSLVQAAMVLVVAVLLGMDTGHITILSLAISFSALFLLALGLSSLFTMLALHSKDWQTQMAIMNLLNLPLIFASNALFPAKIMPSWMQTVVAINPISYAVDIGRQSLLGIAGMNALWFDFLYLAGFAAFFVGIGMVLSLKYLSK